MENKTVIYFIINSNKILNFPQMPFCQKCLRAKGKRYKLFVEEKPDLFQEINLLFNLYNE